ncbi:hypothetical protein JANAI62_13120 [Jannaschia pagri]|uniref:DUF1569 domain-containing protein n=1 Tax=Jannaschia pagri TaxID=2829797 RepID=A0ABQ4NJU5_9RHOB|nr:MULTISPECIES: DUF1569 domain-containing protein [unclassified Jannaschia]GIT90857.1 hypothetical protein JANAI61_13150 [Jannaschia sp. AI_61]GIT94689.1 hypothetical protein JANAI62_13120 [Jannaschia sp. AI_62]
MKRRDALIFTAIGCATLTGAAAYVVRPRDHPHLDLSAIIDRLQDTPLDAFAPSSSWSLARTFDHLAQGVEFSMTGYPDLRSAVFRHTVGPLAFAAFQARGAMSHDTADVIPGEVVEANTADMARDRLIRSLRAFDAHDEAPAPHFAFGALDKAQYAKAHAMHIHDHLDEMRST